MGIGSKQRANHLAYNTPLGVHARAKRSRPIFSTCWGFWVLLGKAFSTLRIWAIWGHALAPTLGVALASAIVPAVNFYSDIHSTSFIVVDGDCFVDSQISAAVLNNCIAITTDVLVLVLTWMKTADVWRASKRIHGRNLPVGTLLLRDGTIYFGMALLMNIVTLILDSVTVQSFDADALSSFVLVLNAVSANLLARFMLDLRSVNEQGSSKSRTMSSINFNLQSLGGNIGAPLGIEDSTWVTGPADDVANERDQQYEEAAVPFRAGLGLDIEEIPLENFTSTGREISTNNHADSAGVGSSTDEYETAREGSMASDSV
ncbi:hypothetical protein EIP91_003863 [Steccherinum ochraceum]|uniref:Transmembrane protein n=1 Tax=Steccherinum ochraceum TaxID=92696 RepID=A0A4R0RLA9_9APHY|nr:hypothetical protein EIP91_003863 [Steccherinum ochraceum]